MAEKCSQNETVSSLLDCSKCTTVVGTTNDNSFHISLLTPNTINDQSEQQCNSDLMKPSCCIQPPGHLPIEIFSDILPYYCAPMCGVYGLDEYILTDPLVLILLPTGDLHNRLHIFPDRLQQCIIKQLPESSNDILFTIIVHSQPQFDNSVDYPLRHLNILFHTWAFKDCIMNDNDDNQMTLSVGIFEPHGINEVNNNDIPEELNGIPFNRLGTRIQHMHNSYSLSPHNCQMECSTDNNLCSFFSMAIAPNNTISLAYHILPMKEELAVMMSKEVSTVTRLGELLTCLNTVTCQDHSINMLQRLITLT